MKKIASLGPAVQFILFSALLCTSLYVTSLFFITSQAENTTLTQADVAIVLGATPYENDTLNPCLVARVQKGVDLFKEGKVKALIVSGGKEEDGKITEAEVMQKIALDLGMDNRYLFLEDKATSTYENIMYSKAGVDYYQATTVAIVTEPYHSPRGYLTAKHILSGKQQIFTAPATESPCWKNNKFGHFYFLREPVALLYYFITGKI